MVLGYRIGMSEARKRFVWPMERVEEGELKFVYFPKEDDENDKILAELAAFKERVVSIVNKDTKSSRVYQFNFQLFPLSDDTRNIGQQEKGMET